MKTPFIVMLFAVLLFCQASLAASFTVKVGDEFVISDVSMDRMEVGPFGLTFGIAGAFDYRVESSNVGSDLDIDVGDHYLGPVVKLHVTPEDSPVDLYAAAYAMLESVRVDKRPAEIYEAGASINGFGIAYQYCPDFKKDDRLLFSWTGRFK